MKTVLIVGSGISGLTCAIECAQKGISTVLVSPCASERAQSVMASGGINAVLDADIYNDSIEDHVRDTLEGGCNIASEQAVRRLCSAAPDIIKWLESLGTVFTRDSRGVIYRRSFGGQRHPRTAYSGTSTGKQIVTALVQEARKYECLGLLQRRLNLQFHSALIEDGICHGALFYNEFTLKMEAIAADFVVMATGGQNNLFGKTTGSMLCDGYATGRLFQQGATLKNLEFIQYHPTTVETQHKRMLISEAARGEGGRLYYLVNNHRVYFMEDHFGPRGNLMPRDVISKYMNDIPSQVYLDITHLGSTVIEEKLSEIATLCRDYAGIDVTTQSIPVAPSVHFFMGGLSVDLEHRTTLDRIYAIGECASMYHGANRLGGNSLLSAIYSGKVAAASIAARDPFPKNSLDAFSGYIARQAITIENSLSSKSKFTAMYIKQDLAKLMNHDLGIIRDAISLKNGIENVEYYMNVADKLRFGTQVSPYQSYSLKSMLTLARAILTCADARTESRGSHNRDDFPESDAAFQNSTVIDFNEGNYRVRFVKED